MRQKSRPTSQTPTMRSRPDSRRSGGFTENRCAGRRGRPPAYREIGKAVGLASPSSVAYQLSILRSNGYLPDLRSLRAAFVPVIGSIPAGSCHG